MNKWKMKGRKLKVLSIINYASAVLTLIFVAITWVLTVPEGEFEGAIDVFFTSIIALVFAIVCAIIVCVQWWRGVPPSWGIRIVSGIVLLFGLGFMVILAVDLASGPGGGVNIGLGLVGIAIHLFGFINGLLILAAAATTQLSTRKGLRKQVA